MIIIEKLWWNSIPSIVPADSILPHESPLILVVWVTNVYHLKIDTFALHDKLCLHLSLFHLVGKKYRLRNSSTKAPMGQGRNPAAKG